MQTLQKQFLKKWIDSCSMYKRFFNRIYEQYEIKSEKYGIITKWRLCGVAKKNKIISYTDTFSKELKGIQLAEMII